MVAGPLGGVEDPDSQAIFDALEDSDCRRIIEHLEEPQTAKELSEDCDLPLSTTYRKLDILTEASLLSERTVIQSDGHHSTQYEMAFEQVAVHLNEEHELTVGIHREAESTDERLESLWAEVRRET
ncbi:helix-turn-helix domain-containing protein [Halodesulfurarchaeum sp.]|uniref:helix-turn-helix domain-containing protein n=1 Tax=Halodesulfurarchaeum sp. TaxID=1980530 RepID=UPI001BC266DC|nr:helix-turn-helix transcriptional regulator [Halodesulfurarchaeum sp.]